jgi:hypothetical protein
MSINSERYLPLVVTVGQVAVFPYYIVWLKEVSLTFTLFAWFFASFSFAAAWGYRVFQTKKNKSISYIPYVYIAMGIAYILVGFTKTSFEYLPYVVLLLQVILGFLQGYFRAWHFEQKTYHLHAVHHYLIIGFTMIGFSFITIVSPVFFISIFGALLCISAFWEVVRVRIRKAYLKGS